MGQVDLFGFPVPYICHGCTRVFDDMKSVVTHSKKHHTKNYKKCLTRHCQNMILNKHRNKFCFAHLNEFSLTNHKLFEIPLKPLVPKCPTCNESLEKHTKEKVWQCVGRLAEKMLAYVPLEVIRN
jgi:Zn finger protein HypA/HybF involved in hydrogenase expression